MRNRSNSGIRLDYFQRLVNRTILRYQNPATGLITSRGEDAQHSWVRDNVYSIYAVWGLALAYRKTADLDEDRAKAFELEKSVVMLMRGLLRCMMMQCDKLEAFKRSPLPTNALHAKYSTLTGQTVVDDHHWGHLQIDATALYILTLAQMTASGMNLIYTLDEVAFIQNLVFYIETAYRTPDYGIWERGDKTNHGLPELNASSIGMAKAALEAINELDLFSARGGSTSVIHVLPDEAQQCQAILMSMLPRESNSKEVDASLLSTIGFPAFAVDDVSVIKTTKDTIMQKLDGKYGCKRFLRDGYKTPKEDSHRLYYNRCELVQFENIESQWPLFFCFYILDGIFMNDKKQVEEYKIRLDNVLVRSEDGMPLVPELYSLRLEDVDKEKGAQNSQQRVANGQMPHMWGQSLYILGRLMYEGFISAGELDPLNRRQIREDKPDVVVQVVILAEDTAIEHQLAQHGIHVQTISATHPIQVHPARVLSQIFSRLGKNKRLGLTGRHSGEIGLLATSKLYTLDNKLFAFIPQFMDLQQFYVVLDTTLLIDFFRTEVAFLKQSWNELGRPTITFCVTNSLLDHQRNFPQALIATMKKLQSGYISGTRVHLGKLNDFVNTSCITRIDFLRDRDDPTQREDQVMDFMEDIMAPTCPRPHLLATASRRTRRPSRGASGQAVSGIIRRSRSIQIDHDQVPELLEHLARDRKSSISRSSYSTSAAEPPHFLHLKTATDSHYDVLHSPAHSPCSTPLMQHKQIHLQVPEQNELNIEELLENLKQSESLQEQADIIHYLHDVKAMDWDTGLDKDRPCTVHDLLVELYEKAGHWKQWWLVRHTAGMLGKRVEDLAIAATDLLVRQKQLSVGMPPNRENIIISPLPPDMLAKIIFESCADDYSTASLTQEVLIYLAMFIRTEPKLFNEMLRLRVGLIIQVMASEMARTLKCSGDEASDHLLNLSPFEMKTLLHHILSGKEFNISTIDVTTEAAHGKVSITSSTSKRDMDTIMRMSKRDKVVSQRDLNIMCSPDEEESAGVDDRLGQWSRRRRLDGALNKVPVGFYPRIWRVLRRCPGLVIDTTTLHRSLTEEMTEGEFKFALEVEYALNQLPEPEYRQLMVEAMVILATIVENDNGKINLQNSIQVDDIVAEANRIFIKEQGMTEVQAATCEGAHNICQHLYDSAPSGRHGSMSFLCRALAAILNLPVNNGELECCVS